MRFVLVNFILVFIIIVILSTSTNAWTRQTQEYYAVQVCNAFPECAANYTKLVKTYSMYADRWYIYPFTYKNHLNYFPDPNCVPGHWICPDFYDQAGIKKAAELLNASYKKTGKDRWKDIALAGHYFFESKEFWHNVMREDYKNCHHAMEHDFDLKFKQNITEFEICKCGVCENTTEIEQLKDEFINYIKTQTAPTNFRMDNSSFWTRFKRMGNDWRVVLNHMFENTMQRESG